LATGPTGLGPICGSLPVITQNRQSWVNLDRMWQAAENALRGETSHHRLKPFLLLISYVRAEARTLQNATPRW